MRKNIFRDLYMNILLACEFFINLNNIIITHHPKKFTATIKYRESGNGFASRWIPPVYLFLMFSYTS